MARESKTITTGKNVLRDEAKALNEIAENLGESFQQAIDLLLNMEEVGRVVIGGMGKSGFIGMKISATLASVGFPSFFLHPAEAVHGDLGRFTKHDIAMLLSNSGETQEILELLPFLQRVGAPIIALTAHRDSTLGRNANIVLELGRHQEAGPLGLAPTTSTTAMLGLGDALAMALVEEKGFSEEEFAGFHPAGSLGRSLLSVSEIMRTGEELCLVPTGTTCREVIHQITETRGRPGAAIIINGAEEVIGIFTDGNLRRCLHHGESFLSEPVDEHMGKDPRAVPPTTLVREATDIMNRYRIDQLIVVGEHQKALGLIDIQDAVSVRLR
jgi:arabinose-5-phosphate isomerase